MTVPKIESYRAALRTLAEWEPYLLAESGLPGPRGNLELAQAAAQEGDETHFRRWLAFDPVSAPTGTREEFFAFCGVVGLGELLAHGQTSVLEELRLFAADPRWRIREAVAMALQRYGDQDMDALLSVAALWSKGNPFEQRATAAALCEPRLLHEPEQARRVLGILNDITAGVPRITDRRSEAFQALRKGLAYCWSVAVAALPDEGQEIMERWFTSDDRDVVWVMRENLKKNRLVRVSPAWVKHWQEALARQVGE